MKKNISIITLVISGILAFNQINFVPNTKIMANTVEAASIETISIGEASKTLALLLEDKNLINSNYPDDSWQEKYIKTAINYGYIKSNYLKTPTASLTIDDANEIFLKLDYKKNTLGSKYISSKEWKTAIKEIIKSKDIKGINEETFVVLGTKNTSSKLSSWEVSTDLGVLNAEGLNLDKYIDKEVRAYIRSGEILFIDEVTNNEPTIKSVYITGNDGENVTIFSGGIEKTYKIKNSEKDSVGSICDLKINGDLGKELIIYRDKITSTIKRVDKDVIELENYDIIQLNDHMKVYSVVNGSPEEKTLGSLVVGTDIAYYVLGNHQVKAAIITKKAESEKIRVVLNTTGLSGEYSHYNVNLSSSSGFILSYGDEKKEFTPNEMLNISPSENADLFGQTRIKITPKNGGKTKISSIYRYNNYNPEYRGVIEVSKSNSGGYLVVNEVDLEDYLYAVVPSEMEPKNGIEAAMVQAIIARTFALNQFKTNSTYHKYGANLDDSVNCQVYNNMPETQMSIEAVDRTQNKKIVYNGEVIPTYFYSTSGGYSANEGEVWYNSAENSFPSSSKEYLISKNQSTGEALDLTIEENADKFYRNTNIDSFDKSFPWFRWNVSLNNAQLKSILNNNLSKMYSSYPHLIKTLQADGSYRSVSIKTLGDIKNIEVLERGDGGLVTKLKISGTENTIIVSSQHVIRFLFVLYDYGAGTVRINLNDGTYRNEFSCLPSAFMTMDKTHDENEILTNIKFYGGGYGHGVGLSQNGVKGMLDRGYSVEDVFKHYYPGTELK